MIAQLLESSLTFLNTVSSLASWMFTETIDVPNIDSPIDGFTPFALMFGTGVFIYLVYVLISFIIDVLP